MVNPSSAASAVLVIGWLAATLACKIDLRTMRLPIRLTRIVLGSGLLGNALAAADGGGWARMVDTAIGGIVFVSVPLALYLLNRSKAGYGDVRLGLGLGLLLGGPFGWWGSLIGAVAAAAINGIGGLVVAKRSGPSTMFPAGPGYLAGAIVAVLIVAAI